MDRIEPESGSVVTAMPSELSIYFNEVINERTSGTPSDIAAAVLLSPSSEPDRVQWRRDRLTVRPKTGFKPGRIYRVEILPVITDLRNNRMRAGRLFVFSTGPGIPTGTLQGTVVDWVAGRPAARALVEAVLMPDSLVYRGLADSGGVFRMSQMLAGHYRVYGVVDQNSDRRRGPRETFDSASVDLDTAATPLELFAFQHDTTGPRLRQVEVVDSLTLKLTFDRPLDPSLAVDTSMVTVAPLDDSTQALPLAFVGSQRGLDSLRSRADSAARADSTQPDSARADSVSADSARADTTRVQRPPARPPAARPGAQPARPGQPSRPGQQPTRAPLDSTRAERMLARRPAPSEIRLVRLATPLTPDARYIVRVTGARSLSGNVADARSQVRVPRPDRQAPAAPTRTRQ